MFVWDFDCRVDIGHAIRPRIRDTNRLTTIFISFWVVINASDTHSFYVRLALKIKCIGHKLNHIFRFRRKLTKSNIDPFCTSQVCWMWLRSILAASLLVDWSTYERRYQIIGKYWKGASLYQIILLLVIYNLPKQSLNDLDSNSNLQSICWHFYRYLWHQLILGQYFDDLYHNHLQRYQKPHLRFHLDQNRKNLCLQKMTRHFYQNLLEHLSDYLVHQNEKSNRLSCCLRQNSEMYSPFHHGPVLYSILNIIKEMF